MHSILAYRQAKIAEFLTLNYCSGFFLIIGPFLTGTAAGLSAGMSVLFSVTTAAADKFSDGFNRYFLRTSLIRNFFCSLKLLGCICSNSACHSCHCAGSCFLKAALSIFLLIRYSSKVIGMVFDFGLRPHTKVHFISKHRCTSLD
jgi:hypothetical protein